jgi:hypothetical protein
LCIVGIDTRVMRIVSVVGPSKMLALVCEP